jgi:hypothetical protein
MNAVHATSKTNPLTLLKYLLMASMAFACLALVSRAGSSLDEIWHAPTSQVVTGANLGSL